MQHKTQLYFENDKLTHFIRYLALHDIVSHLRNSFFKKNYTPNTICINERTRKTSRLPSQLSDGHVPICYKHNRTSQWTSKRNNPCSLHISVNWWCKCISRSVVNNCYYELCTFFAFPWWTQKKTYSKIFFLTPRETKSTRVSHSFFLFFMMKRKKKHLFITNLLIYKGS